MTLEEDSTGLSLPSESRNVWF